MAGLTDVPHDLRILADSAREDFQSNRFDSYSDYIAQFNRLRELVDAQLGARNVERIEPVPRKELSEFGAGFGTQAEKAKLREICDQCSRLLARLGLRGEPKMEDRAASLDAIERICTRFHAVARQLRSRRENRPTLAVEDEYDVQDLFHSLLKLFFHDVRPEEWTPSYAGGAARMDFLLKAEKIVIEVKKTRKSLADKELGDQLIVDIERYAEHPDCETLICFAYDPEARIANPRGLESDLMSRARDSLNVLVFVRPKTD